MKKTLHSFEKDKIPSLNGWNIELFLVAYETIGHDLLHLVEESRVNGYVSSSLNSTFIALIPKSSDPEPFDEYKPISLCIMVYKIISNMFSNIMDPKLVECISKEQFGFLNVRQILNAIGVTRKCTHSKKQRNLFLLF